MTSLSCHPHHLYPVTAAVNYDTEACSRHGQRSSITSPARSRFSCCFMFDGAKIRQFTMNYLACLQCLVYLQSGVAVCLQLSFPPGGRNAIGQWKTVKFIHPILFTCHPSLGLLLQYIWKNLLSAGNGLIHVLCKELVQEGEEPLHNRKSDARHHNENLYYVQPKFLIPDWVQGVVFN